MMLCINKFTAFPSINKQEDNGFLSSISNRFPVLLANFAPFFLRTTSSEGEGKGMLRLSSCCHLSFAIRSCIIWYADIIYDPCVEKVVVELLEEQKANSYTVSFTCELSE